MYVKRDWNNSHGGDALGLTCDVGHLGPSNLPEASAVLVLLLGDPYLLDQGAAVPGNDSHVGCGIPQWHNRLGLHRKAQV